MYVGMYIYSNMYTSPLVSLSVSLSLSFLSRLFREMHLFILLFSKFLYSNFHRVCVCVCLCVVLGIELRLHHREDGFKRKNHLKA